MKLPARIIATTCKLALVTAIMPALLACSNNSEQPRTATVSLSELQSQLGYTSGGPGSSISSPTADESNLTTSVALSVALGAMAIDSRSLAEGPYNTRTPITDVKAQLEADIRNSSNFIVLRNLPTAEDSVEIQIPLSGSKKYQIIAAALSTQPANLGQLEEAQHQDSVIYIGFDERFLGTSPDSQIFELDKDGNFTGDAIQSINIGLIRACLVKPETPPKGCAQYDTDGSVVVTSAVEIIGVYINDQTAPADNKLAFPLLVRSGSNNQCGSAGVECSPAIAKGILAPILAAAGGIGGNSSIEVHVTHQLAPNETPACSADLATTIAGLTANCDVKVFYTPL